MVSKTNVEPVNGDLGGNTGQVWRQRTGKYLKGSELSGEGGRWREMFERVNVSQG